MDGRLCLTCHRLQDDPIHGPARSGLPLIVPVLENHKWDPGERRHLVRRMDDRIKAIENVVKKP